MSRAWRGTFANDPADVSARADIIIPDMDPTLRFTDCRWQSRDEVSLPRRGDPCLVIFDNDREPWVVAWWPYE